MEEYGGSDEDVWSALEVSITARYIEAAHRVGTCMLLRLD